MVIFISVSVLLSFFTLKYTSKVYKREKKLAIKHLEDLKNEKVTINSSVAMVSLICVLNICIYTYYENELLILYCLLLSIVAYTDYAAKWVPDALIFSMVALSGITIEPEYITYSLISIVFFTAPAIFINLIGYVRKREVWIASGDFYIIPTIAVWVEPEHAACLMLIVLMVTISISVRCKKVPMITVIYFSFMGYKLCSLLNIL